MYFSVNLINHNYCIYQLLLLVESSWWRGVVLMHASFEVVVMNLLNWMGHHYNYSVTTYCINVTSIIHKLLISLVAQSEKKMAIAISCLWMGIKDKGYALYCYFQNSFPNSFGLRNLKKKIVNAIFCLLNREGWSRDLFDSVIKWV